MSSTSQQSYEYLVGLNQGYHEVSGRLKRRILAENRIDRKYMKAFDLVRLWAQFESPLVRFPNDIINPVTLVEVKSTVADIPENLDRFFFTLTAFQIELAREYPWMHQFVFVVMPSNRQPFHRCMSWEEVHLRARSISPSSCRVNF